jgi:hypothetical protein
MPAAKRRALLERGAAEAAAWCQRWQIPAQRVSLADAAADRAKGYLPHADTSPEDRTDPGAGFPWGEFLALVQAKIDGEDGGLTVAELAEIKAQLDRIEAGQTAMNARLAVVEGMVRALGGWLCDAHIRDDDRWVCSSPGVSVPGARLVLRGIPGLLGLVLECSTATRPGPATAEVGTGLTLEQRIAASAKAAA